MVDMMLGYEAMAGIRAEIHSFAYELSYADMQHLREIEDRVRAQLIHIIEALRAWERRHADLRHPVKRRYSQLEGALIRQDVRQHWVLYRRAHRDFLAVQRLCHARMRGVSPARRRRRKKSAA
jgi:hypothetical protein